ncbi:MAG: p-hydroxybenzoic acid efflux pump subunit AaeA [Candidatus Anoxychlamydiales bacterium]|nr:p-hydroxybenzoic acid efflux pump subunit AaeA [Candidatus Anoxychlamydiales bacterium]NGX35660.1 p-hydroxybenzoic acid efflux pump subunit AaeA [Candidatus Anoxychlamydiales bacterium]
MKSLSKYFLIIIAAVGIVFAIFMVFYSMRKTKPAPIIFAPPKSPYLHYVAGRGIIEASSENIQIGTPFPELVDKVYVKSGHFVNKEAPLYKLNTQTLEAELNEFEKQKEVRIRQRDDQKVQFSFYQRLKDKNAVSESDYNKQFYNLQIAEKELEETIAKINVTKTNIYRSTIRAPMHGQVLDVNLHPAENAQANPFQKPYLVLFGNTEEFHIKVDVDETDAWRVYRNAPATAYVRGNSSIKIALEFVNIEPFVAPKVDLTGDNREKVDIRVLQLIYKFKRSAFPIYIGQILDVYVEAKPSDYRYNDENHSDYIYHEENHDVN